MAQKSVFALIVLSTLCSGQSVPLTPASSQNLTQPSEGGASAGASLNSNVFEQVRYADQFQWLQNPEGSIAVGLNTVKIKAMRGISAYSCAAPGAGCGNHNAGPSYATTHRIRIAGTGTPEVVTISGTSCVGASTGDCTITFTATSAHPARFTLGTATAGFEEALVDAYTQATNNPVTGRYIACSPYNNSGHFVIYGTIHVDDLRASGVGTTTLDGKNCILEDAAGGGAMIEVGENAYYTVIRDFGLTVFAGIGRAADGSQMFIRDKGQGTRLTGLHFAYKNKVDVVDTLVQVSGDQAFRFDHNDVENTPTFCDEKWCGTAVYGDPTNNAALGEIDDNYFSSGGLASAIYWVSGNGMSIRDNVFQNWIKYPWYYGPGYEDVVDEGGNYYEGNCRLVNPDLGVSGFACNTGPQVSGNHQYLAPVTNHPGCIVHRFSSTGKSIYSYYIVGNKGGKQTKPLYIGDAATDGVKGFDIVFLSFHAESYDVLRAGPIRGDGTDASPHGTGDWAVGKGIVCSASHCSIHEGFSPPVVYTVNSASSTTWIPSFSDLPYWPVPLFIHTAQSTPFPYVGPAVNGIVTADPHFAGSSYYDALFTSGGIGAGSAVTGTRVLALQSTQSANVAGSGSAGAWILPPNMQESPLALKKGKINLASSNYAMSASHDSLLFQTYDSDSLKTFATSSHQPLLDANDCGMGFDVNPSYLAFQCGNAVSFYVGAKLDSGTSPVAQMRTTGIATRLGITSTVATGTAPLSVASTTPVANLAATPTTYNSAGKQQVNSHVVLGSCVLGTSCSVKLAGPAAFSAATSYVCTAQDRTGAFATKVAQSSGSSFTITGNASDTVGYSCVGD